MQLEAVAGDQTGKKDFNWYIFIDCTLRAILQLEEKKMEEWTLREICEHTGVSRRAIQGYEKAELVSAKGKNDRGYLMYGNKEEERIRLIKLLQQLGLSLSEIKQIIDQPKHILKEALEKRVEVLTDKKAEIDVLIGKAYQLIEEL